MGLIDDDDREVGEQHLPCGMVGQDAHMEHVGVGQHDVGIAADVRARLARGVAVVDRGANALGQPEARQRARLVLGERLGGVEVERAGARVAAEDVDLWAG